MPDLISSIIDPQALADLKEAVALLLSTRDAIVYANKEQLNIISGEGGKTLVDLNGNLIRVAESTQKVQTAFDSESASLQRVLDLKAQYNGSTKEIVAIQGQLARTEKELETAELQRQKVATEAAKTRIADLKAEQEALKLLEQQAKANEIQEKRNQAEIAKTAQARKLAQSDALINTPLTITNATSTGTNAANADGTVVSAEETAALREQQEAQAAMTGARVRDTTATAEQTAAGRAFVVMTEEEIAAEREQETTMIAMAAQIKILEAEYRNLTATQRVNAEGLALNGQITDLNVKLRELNVGLGNVRANVGNYPQGMSAAAAATNTTSTATQKAVDRLSSLDNIGARLITTFGRMGIHFLAFTLIFKGIEYLIEKAGELLGLTNKQSESQQFLNGLLKEEANQRKQITDAVGEEVGKLSILYQTATNTGASYKSRLDAVIQLQSIYPNYFANMDAETILVGKAQGAYDALAKSIQSSVHVRVAQNEVKTLSEQLIKAQTDLDALDSPATDDKVFFYGDGKTDKKGEQKIALQLQIDSLTKKLSEATANVDMLSNGVGYFLDQKLRKKVTEASHDIVTLTKQLQILNTALDNTDSKSDAARYNDLKRQRDAIQAEINASKYHQPKGVQIGTDHYKEDTTAQNKALEEQAKNREADLKDSESYYKMLADDDKNSLSDRLLAYALYIQKKKALIVEEKDSQIAQAQNTIRALNDEEAKNESLIGSGKLKPNQVANLKAKNKALEDQMQAQKETVTRLTTEKVTEQNIIENEGAKGIEEITKNANAQRIKTISDGLQDVADKVADSYRAQKDALQAAYDDPANTMSYKTYRAAFDKIQAEQDNETIERQKVFAKNAVAQLLAEADVPPEVIAAIKKKLDALYDKPDKQEKKNPLGLTPEEQEQLKAVDIYVNASIQAANELEKAEKARSDARIQGIQNEIDAIEKKKQADIDAYQNSTSYAIATEAERARAIGDISARAQAREDAQNAKIAQEKRKAAEREKAITIAEIVIKTALAVVNALASDGPLAVPLSIAAGVIGAAELAAAIATPIPSFDIGTDSSPEGLAKVHKGELMEHPTGRKSYVEKDMLTYLQRGTKIHTAAETMKIFESMALGIPTLRTKDGKVYPMDQIMDETATKIASPIVSAINRKRFGNPPHPAYWPEHRFLNTK